MSSNVPYQRLATHEPSIPEEEVVYDPIFDQPTPPWWQRALLILFIIFLHWLAWKLLPVGTKKIEADDTSSLYIWGA